MNLVPAQRMENGLNSPMVFQNESSQFNCAAPHQRGLGDPVRKTREVSDFVTEKMFCADRERYLRTQEADFRRSIYESSPGRRDRLENQNWNGDGSTETPSGGDGSEGDEDEEDDDDDDDVDVDVDVDVDEGDGEVEGLVVVDEGNKNNNSNGSVHSSSDKICSSEKAKHHSSFVGSSRGVSVKEGNILHSANNISGNPSEQHHQQGRLSHHENAVTIAEPDIYYSQFLHSQEGSALGHKEIGGENGCVFSGRKDVQIISESGESLRAILSDPLTGALMDDASILPCGHSFGRGGIQHVVRMKACYTCSHSVSEDSVAPNLSLRAAVQAFRREEDLQSYRASRRRRERFEQDKSSYGDPFSMDLSRGRGVQFPFAVTDRVLIKGNKRTPQRFVGREAVVTTQCLNGWYVVKTLDNAESVKLQYRSLAKVSDSPSSTTMSSKTTPNWL